MANMNTRATRHKYATIERLIRKFAEGPMERDEVAEFLQFSASGVRKYLAELVVADIIAMELIPPKNKMIYMAPRRRYTLISMARAEAWLQAMHSVAVNGHKPAARRLPGPGVHMMEDDTYFPAKHARRGPVRRDPLVAALFGDGPAITPAPSAHEPEVPIQIQAPAPAPVMETQPTPARRRDDSQQPWPAGGKIDWDNP